MPDKNRPKSLIYKEKSNHKVSKALKDSEDLALTYPQKPRSKGCPASVAIASTARRFVDLTFNFHQNLQCGINWFWRLCDKHPC